MSAPSSYDRAIQPIVFLLIFIALSVTYSYQSSMFVVREPAPKFSVELFRSMGDGFEAYKEKTPSAWSSRLYANYLGSVFARTQDPREIYWRIGCWNGVWLMMFFLVLWVFDPRKRMFITFGVFASLYYSFTPITGLRVYPWDMPAMFVFLIIYVGFVKKSVWIVFFATLIGVGFKETAFLGAIAVPFMSHLDNKRKWGFFAALIVLCLMEKLALDMIVGNPKLGFTMSYDAAGPVTFYTGLPPGIVSNLAAWGMWTLNHPIFINCGTFVAFLLLPIRDSEDSMWKIIGLLFLVGEMLFGIITEYRIFHEMIPISLAMIWKNLDLWITRQNNEKNINKILDGSDT